MKLETRSLLACFAVVAAASCVPSLEVFANPKEENVPEEVTLGSMPADAMLARMETAVAPATYAAWCRAHPAPLHLFGENRHAAVRNDILPAHWFAPGATTAEGFRGVAQPGEFYPFQVCVASDTARQLSWRAETDLVVTAVTPTNCAVRAHGVKPIWVMVDVPRNAAGRTCAGRVVVTDAESGETQTLPFVLEVRGAVLADGGVSDPKRLARLKWLESTVGEEETVTKPYTPVAVDAKTRTVRILGRKLVLGADGLPAQITSFFNGSNTGLKAEGFNLLEAPFDFAVTGLGAEQPGVSQFAFTETKPTSVAWRATCRYGETVRIVEGQIDYTGSAKFRIRFEKGIPKTAALSFRLPQAVARYFEGLGRNGGAFPEKPIVHRWTTAAQQDAVWLGRANGGLAVRFKGANYRRPLVNAYYAWRKLVLPESWAAGDGVITVKRDGAGAVVTATSGAPAAGVAPEWNFDLYLTPFHAIDMTAHLTDRYWHFGQRTENVDMAGVRKGGATVVNVHHNTFCNPYINYPYNEDGGPYLRQLADAAHREGLLLKVYYTTRELTQNVPEFFALKSLDGEILAPRDDAVKGWPVTNGSGPNPWLRDHVGLDIIPAWRETVKFPKFYPPRPDLAVITTPDTRWDNFYLAGLDYLVRNYGIDGVYIDDTALSGASFQRARRILDRDGKRRLADNHSWNHHSSLAGRGSSNLVFLELYPYFDLLWRGEGFSDSMPADFWLVERSGAVFGLPGEMLGDCNKIRGMLFGMTDRLGQRGHPQGLWKFFDAVDLPHARFYGWWDEENPIKVQGAGNVKATTWVGRDAVVLVVASFSGQPETVRFAFDEKTLGFTPATCTATRPAIENVQKEGPAPDLAKGLALPPNGGAILVLKRRARATPVAFSRAGYFAAPDSPRRVIPINTGWEFSLDGFKTPPKAVSLPHAIDEGELGFEASGCVNRQQPAWYRKTLVWDGAGAHQFLHFEAIMGKSRITLNGQEVAAHFGGFLPIHAEVTGILKKGDNLLEVWCDNRDDATFPPGKAQNVLDFCYFGGIYRDAYLVETGAAYVTDTDRGGAYVRTFLASNRVWTVKADATLGGDTKDAQVRYFYDGAEVSAVFHPENPALWTPDSPNLHRLTVRVEKGGKTVDAVDVRFGIRDIAFKNGLVLNGKLFRKLIGVNRHQDFAFVGMAMANSLHWRDAKKFRDAGFTIIRSAHYPQDPAFLDACDELGLFLIDATPGWQFWNAKNPLFGERVRDDVAKMVRRDRNHPAILFWEPILNETHYPADFARSVFDIVKREAETVNACACDIVSAGAPYYDILYRNGAVWKKEPEPGRPQFQREFGDSVDDWFAQNSPSRVARAWGEGPMLVQATHDLNATYQTSVKTMMSAPADFFGACLWHGTDHFRGYHPDNFLGGVMDTIRRKKYSYYAFKAALTTEPFVFAANALMPYSPQDVTFYANVPFTATRFGKPLTPITDNNRAGFFRGNGDHNLTVTLTNGEKRVFRYARRFAGFKLALDHEGLAPQADGSDLIVVTAAASDANGNIRRYESATVRFEVEGPAEIVGTNPQRLEFGDAAVLLRLLERTTPESITVRAVTVQQGPMLPGRGELTFTPGSLASSYRIGTGKRIDLSEVERDQNFFGERFVKP